MNGVKNFAIAFCISLIIFGLIAFIIVQFMWPSTTPSPTVDNTGETVQTAPAQTTYLNDEIITSKTGESI